MTKPRLSVVIPTYQRNDELARCLDCLAPEVQSLPQEGYEVIVSDDGRAISAEEMISQNYPWARWTKGPARGIGANRNQGASQANAGWIVFFDSDTLPDPDCLRVYAKAIEANPEAIAFEGAILGSGDMDKEWFRCPVNTHGGLFWTANVAIRTETFRAIGGFDPELVSYHEDREIYERLKQICPVDFLSEAIVIHPARRTTFRHEVGRIPRRMCDLAYFVKRHGPRIGQPNLGSGLLHGMIFQTRGVWQALRIRHYADAFQEFLCLASFPFLFTYFYAKARPTKNHDPKISNQATCSVVQS